MTIRNYALTPAYPGMVVKYTWAGLLNGDTGQPLAVPHYPSKTFTVFGTFGVAGNVIMEGSNDGVNWFTLSDLANATLGTIVANGIKTIREVPAMLRPRVSAGDGTTTLQVDIACICNSVAS